MSASSPSGLDSTRSLACLLAACLAVVTMLEASGLLTWAQRLEIGPLRRIALPAAHAVHDGLQPLGITRWRESLLADLHKLQAPEPMAPRPAPASAVPAASPAPAPTMALAQCQAAAASMQVAVATGASPLPGTALAAPIQAASTQDAATAPTADATLDMVALPQATPLPALQPAAGQPRTVALVGDSMMAVGLSGSLLRGIAAQPRLRAVRAFRSGTGLSRPDVFDWMNEYPAMLGAEKPDTVIVAIGANDGQSFVEDSKVLAFGSDAWTQAYEQRLTRFLDLLTRDGAQVVWMGLPPMRLAKYNQRMMEINRIAYRVVSRHPRASWWNTSPYLADADGQYREYAQAADGGPLRIRAGDGIHLSDEGAGLLTPTLLAWLNPPLTDTPLAAVHEHTATSAISP